MAYKISLGTNSPEIEYLRKKDKRLAKVISMVGDLTYSIQTDYYCFFVHEIIEQMLSIKAANCIFSRLENLCGGTVTPEAISLLTDDQIRATGTSSAKVEYIRSLTTAVISGILVFDDLINQTDEEIIHELTSFRGIGTWTAKMFLIFGLNRPDVLPYEDAAFLQSYKWMYKTSDCSKESIMKRCKKWKPYSSIAARYLYRALDYGLTKDEFHLFK